MKESFVSAHRLAIGQAGQVITEAAFACFGIGFGIEEGLNRGG